MEIDKRILAGLVIVLILVFAGGVKYAEIKQARLAEAEDLALSIAGEQTEDDDIDDIETTGQASEIKVYITGAVKNPGVYTFTADNRIYEALEVADPQENAELRYIEMARILQDQETIYVPAQGEIEEPQLQELFSASAVDKKGKININKATVQELSDNLNGIGPALAQRIVDYREANGGFKTTEEIKNVNGIGEKRYAEIKEQIVVK